MNPTIRAARTAALAIALVACSADRLTTPSVASGSSAARANTTGPSLVITEIMVNSANFPAGGSTEQEWFEVYNAGNASADLSAYQVFSVTGSGNIENGAKAITPISAGALVVAPGQCVVIANNLATGATNFGNVIPGVTVDGTFKMALGNSGTDWIALRDDAGASVDSVNWSGSAMHDGRSWSINVTAGADPTTVNNLQVAAPNWVETATDGPAYDSDARNHGTPGTCNYGSSVVGDPTSLTITPATASFIVNTTQPFTVTGDDGAGHTISNPPVTWSSSDEAIVTIDPQTGVATGQAVGDATVTATFSPTVTKAAIVHVLAEPMPLPSDLPSTRFTEIHYDNDGTDANEAIEIEGDAGVSLAGWSIVLYTGSNGTVYKTVDLSGTFANSCNGRGALSFSISGIQNGGFDTVEPDGFALVNNGVPVQFLSYEGQFTATDGPLAGLTSTDIGVEETSSTTSAQSLQFNTAGTWEKRSASFGVVNACAANIGTASISISHSGPDTLVVGWQRRAFVAFRDANGTTVSPTPPITWTSDTPGIATVDALGYATGVSAGTAIIRATIGTTSGTYSFKVIDYQPVVAQYRNHIEFGAPSGADPAHDVVLSKPGYVTSYNSARGGPNWVSWNINASTFGDAERCECFSPDTTLGATPTPGIPRASWITDQHYIGTGGYDRGHMVQSESRTSTASENAATFLMTNILPQASNNNQGAWLGFEEFLNARAQTDHKQVYVVAGGEYVNNPGTLANSSGRVAIPDFTWKVAIVVNNGGGLSDVHGTSDITMYAVRIPNLTTTAPATKSKDYSTYVTTVDDIEARTGYDFFAALPDNIENVLEANDRAPTAAFTVPAAALEGAQVSFDASSSSDPDAGDFLTYAWTFSNGTTSTSVTPTVVFADNGVYTANLTVTDKFGATSTLTKNITVSNVAPAVTSFAGATILRGETYASNGTFTDPGADTHTATVNYGDGSGSMPLPLGATAFALSHAYGSAGTFTVTVTVTDDEGDSASRTATVTVLSATSAIGVLSGNVDALVAAGTIISAEAHALQVSLDAALRSLEKGNAAPAGNQLEAFINKVEALRGSGRISAATAQALIDYASRAIASIG